MMEWVQINLRIPVHVRDEIDRRVENSYVPSRNQYIVELIKRDLERRI